MLEKPPGATLAEVHALQQLAEAQGLSEAEVVARAMAYANDVLNGDGEDLGGSIAAAQMAHIARHKPFLRKQFRPSASAD